MTTVLSLLTLAFSVPPSSTAAVAHDEGAAAFSFDDAAEARELDALDRATRKARADAAVRTGLGSVEVKTATTTKATRSQPRTEPRTEPKKATGGKTESKAAGKKTTGRKPATQAAGTKKAPPPVAASGGAAKVVAYANAQIGKRYVFGTAGPMTFDCSGLVVAAYRQIGISLPHQTTPLAMRGRAVSRAELKPGDLVFPSSGHVGIYVGGGMIVHASTPKSGVKKSTIYAFWKARRIVG